MNKFLLISFFVFIVVSCNTNNIVENQLNKIEERLGKPICGYMDKVVWQLDRYELVAGKSLGVWPQDFSTERYDELKNIYGFNKALFQSEPQYANAINAGYHDDDLFCFLGSQLSGAIYNIETFTNVWGYYVDEPLEYQYFNYDQLMYLRSEIDNNYTGNDPKYFIGSKTNPYTYPVGNYPSVYKNLVNQNQTNYMMFTQYEKNWLDDDQRSVWTQFSNYYGTENVISQWIHSRRDEGEFFDLIQHATTLDINTLWLFIASDGTPFNVAYFCGATWQNGWLRKFERKYIYEYRCSYPDPCECDPELPGGWYVYKRWPMNEYREVFFNNETK